MKKTVIGMLMSLVMVASIYVLAQAAVYTYTPTPADLGDLDHANYYTWGINPSFNLGSERIVNAVLSFRNIYDWTKESDDKLFLHLLDNPALGVTRFSDNQGGGDNFAGQGALIGIWTDPIGGYPRGINLSYNFGQLGLVDELTQYIANDGIVGFGADPDCHYYNNGVKFEITTTPIPEPGSMLLLGSGLLGLVGAARKKLIK